MNAEEARRIWRNEVEKESKKFIDYIEKKILSDTYQENISLYLFSYTDFNEYIDLETEDEFCSEVLKKTADYFQKLGFHVKSDLEDYKLWLAYLKKELSRNNIFTENLFNLLQMKKYYRFNLKKNILENIEKLIREKAKRKKSLEYDLTINIPNENSLLLDDLQDIVNELLKAGYEVNILSLERGLELSSIPEILENKDQFIFTEKQLRLIIKW